MLTFVANSNPASRRTGPEFASRAVRTADTSWAYYVQLWVSFMFIKILNQSLLVTILHEEHLILFKQKMSRKFRVGYWFELQKYHTVINYFCCKLPHQINKVTSRLAKCWPQKHVFRQRIGWWERIIEPTTSEEQKWNLEKWGEWEPHVTRKSHLLKNCAKKSNSNRPHVFKLNSAYLKYLVHLVKIPSDQFSECFKWCFENLIIFLYLVSKRYQFL